VRSIGTRHASRHGIALHRRIAGGAALAVAAATVTILGTAVPAFATSTGAATVTPLSASAGSTTNYSIVFVATNAIAVGETVTIAAPAGTVFPTLPSRYTVNTVATTAATTGGGTATIQITSASIVAAGATATVVATGVKNPAAGAGQTLTVATTADATATTSTGYAITAATAVTAVSNTPVPLNTGATAVYTVGFTATTALVSGVDTITIASAGLTFPAVAGSAYTVQDGGGAATNVTAGTPVTGTVTLTTPVTVTAGSAVQVVITGITNPSAGSHTLSVSTSQDSAVVAAPAYTITTVVTAVTVVSVVPLTAAATAIYTLHFVLATTLATTDSIKIAGPAGTVFQLTSANYTVSDNGAAAVVVGVTPTHTSTSADVAIRVPVAIVSGHTVTVVASGITNPAAGTYTLTAATTQDITPSTSGTYTITAVSGGGPVATTPATPVRFSGSDRFGTAISASLTEYPSTGSAGAVVLARADDYPDALVGAALASSKNAPLLFANGGLLTPATQAEIQRVLPAGGTVYLLGGTAAIPASVATTLTGLGFVPVRYAGADRFATAIAVADALNDPGTVLLATGINFPDALAAGPAAAHLGGVVLLTAGATLPASVQTYLTAHPGTVYAIGGPAVAADPSATPLSGADRYATAAAVAAGLFTSPANVGVASGTTFADALSGGAFQAHFHGPIVLSDPGTLPSSTSTYLTGADTTIVTTNIFGGTSALSTTVQTAIGVALGL
jgi:putative cell wall-binding protein